MKIAVLPALQDTRNKKINKGLKALGVWLGVALSVYVGSALYIYVHRGTNLSNLEIRSSDGALLGPAIPAGADFVLCNCKSPSSVTILSPGGSVSGITVKAAVVALNDFSLIRIDSPLTQQATPANLDQGAIGRVSEGDHYWTGPLIAGDRGLFTADRDIQCEPGTPVYSASDPAAMIGVVIQSSGKQVIVPMRDVVRNFPELR
jgi:hypothetical protein